MVHPQGRIVMKASALYSIQVSDRGESDAYASDGFTSCHRRKREILRKMQTGALRLWPVLHDLQVNPQCNPAGDTCRQPDNSVLATRKTNALSLTSSRAAIYGCAALLLFTLQFVWVVVRASFVRASLRDCFSSIHHQISAFVANAACRARFDDVFAVGVI